MGLLSIWQPNHKLGTMYTGTTSSVNRAATWFQDHEMYKSCIAYPKLRNKSVLFTVRDIIGVLKPSTVS